MTTSDADPTKQAFAGLPDPELVASWANEFFKAGAAGAGTPAPAAASPAPESLGSSAPASPANAPLIAPATPRTAPAAAGTSFAAPAAPTTSSAASAAPGGVPALAGFAGGPPISEFWSAFVAVPALNSVSPESGVLDAARASAGVPDASAPAATSSPTAFGSVPGGDVWSSFIPFPGANPGGVAPESSAPEAAPAAHPSGTSFYFLEQAGPAPSAGVQPRPTQPSQSTPDLGLRSRQFDVATIRRDFPILEERVNGRRLVWLDNAATTQKPQVVIDRLSHFYAHENSNVHRGAHTLAARSSDAYEAARETVRRFINAPSAQDVVFVRGATEAINLVSQSWGRRNVHAGDEIIISWLEHHSNIVPWQLLASETGARVRVAPIDDSGQIRLDEYEKLFNPRTRIVSVTQVSNALGTVTPVKQLIEIAHRYGVPVLVDGAQAVSHFRTDVQALDADFYVFSGHKVFGPTGIGALYGRSDLLSAMPPWQGGGNMIADVSFDKTVYNPPPSRFEAGTGNIADAVGLGAALDYLDHVGLENVARYEHDLLAYLKEKLVEVPRLRLIGTAKEQAGVQSFVIDGLTNEQIGGALAREGIAVRAGHHCAQPALRRFGLEGSVRPSLALYNTCEEIDALVHVLLQLQSGW